MRSTVSASETAAALAATPLFEHVDRSEIERIAGIARPVFFPAGFEIVTEGDDGLGFFVITEGEVEVVRGTTRLAELGKGQWFGEMALLDDLPRSAMVRAIEPTRAFVLYRHDFLTEVRKNEAIAIALLKELSSRLRTLDARLAAE